MKRVKATALQMEYSFRQPVDISQVRFEWEELVVTLMSTGDRKAAVVRFAEVSGFRMLDEGDLLEFWPACSKEKGWLFAIDENGWLDFELSRAGFLQDKGQGSVEYFIASQNRCVSVISSAAPNVVLYSI